MDWYVCTPQIHMFSPNKCDGIRRWGPWKVISPWGWSPLNGISALIRGTPESSSLTPSASWGQWEDGPLWTWMWALSRNLNYPGLHMDFPTSRNTWNKFLMFKIHPFYGSLLQQPKWLRHLLLPMCNLIFVSYFNNKKGIKVKVRLRKFSRVRIWKQIVWIQRIPLYSIHRPQIHPGWPV